LIKGLVHFVTLALAILLIIHLRLFLLTTHHDACDDRSQN
jgi:hypothetical protein